MSNSNYAHWIPVLFLFVDCICLLQKYVFPSPFAFFRSSRFATEVVIRFSNQDPGNSRANQEGTIHFKLLIFWESKKIWLFAEFKWNLKKHSQTAY